MNENVASPAAVPTGLTARAVERALDGKTREAEVEVERILNAALRVIHRVEPASPRVADIIAEAGSSNQAFYRYFAGKDDLFLAVMDRGVAILRSYLEHQMTKDEGDPVRQVARWIAAILAQTDDPQLSRESRAVGRLVDGIRTPRAFEAAAFRSSLLAPLHTALQAAGARSPEASAHATHDATFGALNRHLQSLTPVPMAEREFMARFCLEGAGLPAEADLTGIFER